MKKFKAPLFLALLVLLTVAVIGCGQQGQSADQNTDKQPATEQQQPQKDAAKEQTPNFTFVSSTAEPEACASCHKKISDDKDYSLAAEVKNIEGHPQVSATTVADCMECHKSMGDKSFKKLLHKVHLTGGQDNHFVANYGGSCIQCHKQTENGSFAIPGLAAEGTKYVDLESAQVDKADQGCLSCHKKISDEKDYSLSAELKNIPNHPTVNATDVNICFSCHANNGMPLDQVLHTKHLTGEHYKSNYGNSCVNCHKVNDDGTVILKGKKQA